MKIPSVGGVARSDSGREAPGWVRSRFHNPPQGLTALAPPERGESLWNRPLQRKYQESLRERKVDLWPAPQSR